MVMILGLVNLGVVELSPYPPKGKPALPFITWHQDTFTELADIAKAYLAL